MLHWSPHNETSLARRTTAVTSKVNAPAYLHSPPCTQERDLLKGPPIAVQSRQVHFATSVASSTWSQSHSTWLGCSKHQSGPPQTDCCLLQPNHVERDRLHVDRTTLVAPQLSTHLCAVSHTQHDWIVASTNQGGPTDYCLLQLDHVECNELHVDRSTPVTKWTCLDRTEMGGL